MPVAIDQTPWTTERIDQLKQLWADGKSASQISMRLDCGLSRNAVIGKVYRLGLASRKTRTTTPRYRSGPVGYEEKQRREAERITQRQIAKAARKSTRDALEKICQNVRKVVNHGSYFHITTGLNYPQPVEAETQSEFLAVTFSDLNRDHCHYPRGEGAELRFCGQPRLSGHSYCLHCYRICHRGDADRRVQTGELVVLPAGTPPLSGVTGGQSAA